ncbi:MAG: Ig-like domain-containing protein [Myxococcaceae bacterium]|nr:Ig-like domain-containing protein [Myxococcaceae bacterium]
MVRTSPWFSTRSLPLLAAVVALGGCNCGSESSISPSVSTMVAAPATIIADGVERSVITVTLKSTRGEVVPGAFVSFASASPGVQLVQPAGPTDANGVAQGSLTATVEGEKVVTLDVLLDGKVVQVPLTATVTALPNVSGSVTRLAFLQQPMDTVAGNTFAPPLRVALQDDSGATVTRATGAVRLTLMQAGAAATLAGTTLGMAQAGVATFTDLSVARAGQGYRLVATAGTLTATSAPFSISAAAAASLVFTTQPAAGVAGQPLTPAPVVELRDRFGNAVVSEPTLTITPLSATMGRCPPAMTTMVMATRGAATLSALSLSCADTWTLAASATGLTSATSASFVVRSAPLHRFGVEAAPAAVVAGSGPTVTVSALDAFDNVVTDYTGTATFSSTDPRATVPGPTPFLATDLGRRSFMGGAVLRTAGAQTLSVADGAVTGQAVVTVSPGPVASLAFSQQPSAGTVRAALATAPAVTALDAFQNLVPSFAAQVTVALTPATGALTGTTAVNAVAGVATFPGLAVTNEGVGFRLLATTAAMGVADATSNPFDVIDDLNPSAIAQLDVTLGGPTSLQLSWLAPGDDGALGTATSYELRVSPAPFGPTQPGAVVGNLPAPAAAGTPQTFTVTGLSPDSMVYFSLRALDGAGNAGAPVFANLATAPCPQGTTGATCQQCAGGYVQTGGPGVCTHVCTAANPCTNPPPDVCVGTTQVTTHPNPGVCTPTTTGSFFACAYPPTTAACGAGRECSPTARACVASPPTFVITVPPSTTPGLPSPITAGSSTTVLVRVRDSAGNDFTGYTGTIRFSSSDPAASLPPDFTFTASDSGAKTFPGVIFRAAGTRSLTVTDAVLPTATTTVSTTVTAGAATRLAFVQQPGAGTVRAPLAPAPSVRAVDDFDNPAPADGTVVTLSLGANPVAATLAGTTSRPITAGVATFSGVSLERDAAGFTLTATATALLAATSSAFTVTDGLAPDAPALTVDVASLSQTSATVRWTAPGDDGALGDLPPGSSYVFKYATTALTALNFATTGTVVATPPPGVAGVPQSVTVAGLSADTTYFFALRVDDGAGNTSFGFTSGATLPCPTGTTGATCQQCASGYLQTGGPGVCTHVCLAANPCTAPPPPVCAGLSQVTTYPNPGACTPTTTGPFYSCAYAPTTSACGSGLECQSGACVGSPPTFVITVPPSTLPGLPASLGAGASTTVLVTVKDSSGNDFTGYRGTVAFSSTDPAATLPATFTFTAMDNGARTFPGVVFRTAGSRTLTVTDTVLPAASTSASTTVLAGSAARLAFVQQPGAGTVRAALTPAPSVRALDAFGNAASAEGTAVSLGLSANPAGATLGGATTQPISAGLATFGGLTLDREAAGFSLSASAPGLTAATSDAFTLTDDLAPGPVADFAVDSLALTPTSAVLTWTAPGDDGPLGDLPASASYTVKYATTPLTALNFATTGTAVTTGFPSPVGFPESVTVSGLVADTPYFFALRVDDGAGNTSFAFTSASTSPCPVGATGPACLQCANGYVQTGGPGVCTHVCTAANPCTAGQPASTCTGDTLTTYTTVCTPETVPVGGNYYSCTWPAAPTDCSAVGQICLTSPTPACVPSPCTAGSCSAPAPACTGDGLGRITYGAVCTPLTPTTFSCAFPPTTTACAPVGSLCSITDATCYPAVSAPLANELVVTEVQHTPAASAPQGQYVELYNRTSKNLNVGGLEVTDKLSTASFTLPAAPRVVTPGSFFVLGASTQAATNGGIAVNIAWPGGFSITKPSGASVAGLQVRAGATVVDDFQWTTAFPAGPDGTAMELSSHVLRTARASSRGRAWYWCNGVAALPTSSGFGSPGADNGTCGMSTSLIGWCIAQYPTVPSEFPANPLPASTPVDLYSRFYAAGLTSRTNPGVDDYPWVQADFGHDVGTNATTWRFWAPVDFNFGYAAGGNNDEMVATQLRFPFTGTFNFGFRYRLLDPFTQAAGSWTYCDRVGTFGAGPTGTWGTVTVSGGQPLPEAQVVVVRVGDGAAALASNATAAFLERRATADGALQQTVPLPTAGAGAQAALTLSGTATSEGALSRSADGRYVTLAGYDAAPGTASVTTSSSATVNRVVGRLDSAGAVDTSTRLNAAFSGGNVRAATSADGTAFWATGSTSGAHHVVFGSAGGSTPLNTASPTNLRAAHVVAGQLYLSAASGSAFGVLSLGVGLPTTGGQTPVLLPGFPSTSGPSPYGFAALDLDATAGIDTIYVAQDTAPGANSVHVQKWTLAAGTWSQQAFLPALAGSNSGTRGLAAVVTDQGVRVVATTTETSANRLVTFLDTGTPNPAVTVLATAAANTVFRGVAFAPTP